MNDEMLWQYSLKKYAEKEVQDACLSLQDEYAYNVNVLLFCMLCDANNLALSPVEIRHIKRVISASDKVLIEHRERRREAKTSVIDKDAQNVIKHTATMPDSEQATSPKSSDNAYNVLLQQELTLEAAQQSLIIKSFLVCNTNAQKNEANAPSALTHYLRDMLSSATEIANEGANGPDKCTEAANKDQSIINTEATDKAQSIITDNAESLDSDKSIANAKDKTRQEQLINALRKHV